MHLDTGLLVLLLVTIIKLHGSIYFKKEILTIVKWIAFISYPFT